MKIYMLWDMEGVSGLFTREQVWFWEPDTDPRVAEEGRRLLVADANAAIRAALDAGVDELIVCDTHHGGGNIRPDEILSDRRVTFQPRSCSQQNGKKRWMADLEGCDGLMLMGHHAMAGTPNAFLPHSNTTQWADFRINGRSVGEIGIESCFAGHFDVPLVLVHGEAACCPEAESLCPGVVTAPVKHAVSRDLCNGLDPEAAHRFVAERVAEAVVKARARTVKPFQPALPMTVSIRMREADDAQKALARPGVRRVDDHTVDCRVDRRADVMKWITDSGLE